MDCVGYILCFDSFSRKLMCVLSDEVRGVSLSSGHDAPLKSPAKIMLHCFDLMAFLCLCVSSVMYVLSCCLTMCVHPCVASLLAHVG